MQEAVVTTNPKTVCHMFALLLTYSEIQDPVKLLTEFINDIGKDFQHVENTTGLTQKWRY